MSNYLRKVKRNQGKLKREKYGECLEFGRMDKEENKMKLHLNNCEFCRYTTALRILIVMRGKFWIRKRDHYLCLKYKGWTYHHPLSEKIFEEVGISTDELYKKRQNVFEGLVDYALFGMLNSHGVREIDRNDKNYLDRCSWNYEQEQLLKSKN